MDVLSPFISVLCHSDWLFHGESCPRLVGVRGPRKTKSKNWGSDPRFWRGGGAKFSIGPRSAPSGGGTVLSRSATFCSHISQWAPLRHLPALAQNPWNILPQSPPNSASILKFRFFSPYLRGSPTPTRRNIGHGSSAFCSFCRAPDSEQMLQILLLYLVRFWRYGPAKLVQENLGEKWGRKKLSPKNVNGSKKVSAKRKSLNFGMA